MGAFKGGDEFGDEPEKAEEKASDRNNAQDGPVKRRLYRNPDDKLLGGVCSGIASYFDVDAVWVRLAFAFIFFVFGSGFLLYILLWIIVPEAKTTAEKLQMRGEPVTISNIEKNVKEEMEQVRKTAGDSGKEVAKKAQIGLTAGIGFDFWFMTLDLRYDLVDRLYTTSLKDNKINVNPINAFNISLGWKIIEYDKNKNKKKYKNKNNND